MILKSALELAMVLECADVSKNTVTVRIEFANHEDRQRFINEALKDKTSAGCFDGEYSLEMVGMCFLLSIA